MRIQCPDCEDVCRGEDVGTVKKAYQLHAKKVHNKTFSKETPRTTEQILSKKPGRKRTHNKGAL